MREDWEIMEIMVQFNVDNRYMKTRISLRLLQTYFVGAMALLAGCQQEMTEPEINQDNNREVPVVLTARQGGGTDARTTYTPSTPEDDGSIAMGVKWDGGEDEMLAYTYYNKEGAGVHFNCLFPVENSISADGKSQDFEGTIIKNDEENGLMHYIFYPCPRDNWITKDVAGQTLTVRYPMNNQVQDCTPGNETKHLAAYDIMRAMDFEVESGNTTIEFEHLTSLLYMDFTLPENKAISTIKLISDKAIFGTEYRMKFKVLYSGCESGTDDDKMATTMDLTLQNDAADNSVKGYLMLTPYGIPTSYAVNISAEAIAADGTVYQSGTTTINIASGYLFEPGKCKTMKRTLTKKETYVKDGTTLTLNTSAGGLTSLLQSLPTTAYEDVTTLKIEGTLSNDDLKQTTNNELFNTEYSLQSSILGNWLRSYAGGITTLDLSAVNGLTIISEMAFYGCGISSLGNSSLKKVILPEGVVKIDKNAFLFAQITEIVLPATLKTIGHNALGDTDLSTVTLPQGLEIIEDFAFLGSDVTTLIIPSTVTSIGMSSLPTHYLGTTIVFEGTTYGLLDVEKFGDSMSMEYVSLLLPSVTTYSAASDIKEQCTFVHEMMNPMDPSIIETMTFAPKVYYNWSGSGTYENATDSEKLNKANYTSL